MKILILTLSYFDNGIYSKFYEIQNKTWNSVNVDGLKTYFYIGNCNENIFDGNIIKTNVKEHILNCGFKTIEAFKLIKDLDFDYVFRTNSSSYIDKNLLKKYLLDKPREKFYSGVVGDYKGILFSSGSGYIISKDLIKLILNNLFLWNHYLMDDVALSLILKNFMIYPVSAPRCDVPKYDINNNVIDDGLNKIPLNFYHYRLKSKNRDLDCDQMINLHKMKIHNHN